MPSAVWTLTYAEETRTLAEWGLGGATLERLSQGKDMLVLSVQAATSTDALLFAMDATLTIQRDEVTWFSGRVIEVPNSQTQPRIQRAYRVAGPWWYLENLPYTQVWRSYLGVAQDFARVVMFASGADRELLSTATQITGAVQLAITKGAPMQIGTIDAAVQPPAEKTQSLQTAELLIRAMRWMKDAAVWFDYTTDPPTFHCRRAASFVNTSLASGATLEISMEPHRAQAVPVVEIVMKLQVKDEGDTEFKTVFNVGRWPAAYAGPPWRGMHVPLDAQDEVDFAVAPVLAHQVYDSANANNWRGTIRLIDQDCHATLRPGMTIDVTGDREEYATMHAIVQSVTYDVFAGSTVVQLGPPDRLAPQDLLELLRLFRNRIEVSKEETREQATGFSTTNNYGMGDASDKDEDDKDPTKNGYEEIDVTYCGDDGEVTRKFLVKKDE